MMRPNHIQVRFEDMLSEECHSILTVQIIIGRWDPQRVTQESTLQTGWRGALIKVGPKEGSGKCITMIWIVRISRRRESIILSVPPVSIQPRIISSNLHFEKLLSFTPHFSFSERHSLSFNYAYMYIHFYA